jgi:hypothetical protein
MTDIDRLIPVIEAFEMAGMRRTRGYAEITAKRLAIVRNGRRTFVRASELRRYLDSLTVGQQAA